MIKYEIRKNTYYDSVTLMLISKDIKAMDGVEEALVGMGTDLNKELATNLNLSSPEVDALTPNDFFIVAKVDDEGRMAQIVEKVDDLLNQKKVAAGSDYRPATLDSALEHLPEANMVVISVPGKYAAAEVRKALNKDLHVMLFSDNVPVEDERKLKELAIEKGLLMMGPDCGTAIINQVPLAFANVIRKGNIGVVGASGTGTQEVTVLIDKLGGGTSQVIGTGGRDLKSEVGGLMMIQGMEALMNDPATEVIVLISKPPAPEVAAKVLELVKQTSKPVVVDFIGGNPEQIVNAGAIACTTLEDTAHKAVALAKGQEPVDFDGFSIGDEVVAKMVAGEKGKMASGQKYLRGLYTGGTLADEAMKMLGTAIGGIYSNIPLSPEFELASPDAYKEHTCIDLGDDMFTVGRPHPMIDPSTRTERVVDAVDETVAVMLLDIVLGYGSHMDPAGEMVSAIEAAKQKLVDKGGYLSVVCSICGTEGDPQSLANSKKALEDAGVIVMESNAQAVRFAERILKAVQ